MGVNSHFYKTYNYFLQSRNKNTDTDSLLSLRKKNLELDIEKSMLEIEAHKQSQEIDLQIKRETLRKLRIENALLEMDLDKKDRKKARKLSDLPVVTLQSPTAGTQMLQPQSQQVFIQKDT